MEVIYNIEKIKKKLSFFYEIRKTITFKSDNLYAQTTYRFHLE